MKRNICLNQAKNKPMKKLNFFDKLIYILNSIFAFILILSYIIPKIKPSILSSLSFLSLLIPIIFVVNMFFVVYWIVKLKRQFLLSFIILLLGSNYVKSFINFSNNSEYVGGDKISIMSYNINVFNYNKFNNELEQKLSRDSIIEYSSKQGIDIISFQEYSNKFSFELESYPYKFESVRGGYLSFGQATFSKFPIYSSGTIKFENSNNGAIFTDIIINRDTIRIYNAHLQSFKFDKSLNVPVIDNAEKLITDLNNTFQKQQSQAEILLFHMSNSPYKVVVSGDFNNTAFSYVYNLIKSDLKDSFVEKGNFLGQTYNYNSIPLRIDFILVDKSFKVNDFKIDKVDFTDHYPIISEFSVN